MGRPPKPIDPTESLTAFYGWKIRTSRGTTRLDPNQRDPGEPVIDLSGSMWRKSSYSSDNYGQCVELAVVSKVGGVRDTNQIPESP